MTTPPQPGTEDVAALQDVLAGEHAAVWVHGVIGARTSQSGDPALYDAVAAAYVAHRDLRDDLVGMLAALGAQPVAPATAYELPSGPGASLEDAAGLAATALQVETAVAATCAAAVGRAAGEVRRQAIGWLSTTAVRELTFRGTPEMFPGAGEHADR